MNRKIVIVAGAIIMALILGLALYYRAFSSENMNGIYSAIETAETGNGPKVPVQFTVGEKNLPAESDSPESHGIAKIEIKKMRE